MALVAGAYEQRADFALKQQRIQFGASIGNPKGKKNNCNNYAVGHSEIPLKQGVVGSSIQARFNHYDCNRPKLLME
jgi:hypothetical protein